MLRLRSETSLAWVHRAIGAMDEILIDHAHCEKKAASTAINLIFRYQDKPALMRPLSELAREELEHFEQVLGVISARGGEFGRQTPPPYAGALHKAVRGEEPARLLDTLLCCALIEARSCERMKLLSEHLADEDLAAFYKGLLACEARHHRVYVELAVELFGDRDAVLSRLEELAAHEAQVLAEPLPIARLHA
ncbi:MAG: tRNA-(ms[2]io[6]A)-hydroxylase [Deltaproteobacteria bacterium]|nr:tRNA-(ms[2]io[6]A)-hydroxylase [Deltaproteobacteria bacterium]